MEKMRTSDPLSVPPDGAVALDTTAGEAPSHVSRGGAIYGHS